MQDDFSKIMTISASGMRAQGQRMKLAAENLSNIDSPGYRRKQIYFRNEVDRAADLTRVAVSNVTRDQSPLERVHDPNHPLADPDGYVDFSNVNAIIEMMDMKEAERSFSAGMRAFDQAREMFMRTLELLRN